MATLETVITLRQWTAFVISSRQVLRVSTILPKHYVACRGLEGKSILLCLFVILQVDLGVERSDELVELVVELYNIGAWYLRPTKVEDGDEDMSYPVRL